MDISVLFATYCRPEILGRTLESFCSLETNGLKWEVLVVGNANDEATVGVVKKFRGQLPLSYLLETGRGKNNALNRAIEFAKGKLHLFTDDDILADPGWLVETWKGTQRWPHHLVFGGRVLGKFPPWENPITREK